MPQKKYYGWNFKHGLKVGVTHGSRTGKAQLSMIIMRGCLKKTAGMFVQLRVGDEVRCTTDKDRRLFIMRISGGIEPNQKLK